ncbi:unnamed protein product [Gemmata massiliana]|uniref:Uncharacterized protein n=1 Tax=Gemmata massiliana TaxID=1210884 RepID=A0A6P2CTZ0_9BACT|nr:unnamed protein product [Gemmata massiliana]
MPESPTTAAQIMAGSAHEFLRRTVHVAPIIPLHTARAGSATNVGSHRMARDTVRTNAPKLAREVLDGERAPRGQWRVR